MAARGWGWAQLVLITLLLTFINPAVIAEEEAGSPNDCADFRTSGFFHNKDLHVQFLLFTPRNPTCAQTIDTNSISNSTFNATHSTKVIIHGFRVLGTKPSWIDKMVESLLAIGPVNVVVVDWVYGSTAMYNQAVDNVPKLGVKIVALINGFLEYGSTTESFHLIGSSLGAHVAGHVGRLLGGRINRITGLDPAGYKFTRTTTHDRLDPGDAVFVEAIHTDTDNFGIRIPVGHVDYFINGGRDQPGCQPGIRNFYGYLICDHMRAITVFLNAIRGICTFIGFPCDTYQMFRDGLCVTCDSAHMSSCPQIGTEISPDYIGGDILLSKFNPDMENSTEFEYLTKEDDAGRGNVPQEVFLMTTSAEPFCAHHILLEFTLSQEIDSSVTIEVQLRSTDSGTRKSKITIPKHAVHGRSVTAHAAPLCRVNTVIVKVSSTLSRLWRRAPDFRGTLCLSQLPLNRREKLCLSEVLSFSDHSSQTHNLSDISHGVCH